MKLVQKPLDGILLPGYKIRCASCKRNFMEIIRPLRIGESFFADRFRYVNGEFPNNYDDMTCMFCGADFHDLDTLIHTNETNTGFFVYTKLIGK